MLQPSNWTSVSKHAGFELRCGWRPGSNLRYDGTTDLVAFCRQFIASSDVPKRQEEKLPLNDYDRTLCLAARVAWNAVEVVATE